MSLLSRTKKALSESGISEWRIELSETHSREYFFVKRELDTRRIKDTEKCAVTVFRADGDKKGSVKITLIPSMSPAEISSALSDAYFAASFAMNPGYEQPDPVRGKKITGKTITEDDEKKMIGALLAEPLDGAFINSAEIFFVTGKKRVISSGGTDVSWDVEAVKGEFVAQCREPEDVEHFEEFEYDVPDEASLREKTAAALRYVKDRAGAAKILKSGKYDVVLCADQLPEILSYYGSRSSAAMIYPGYSEWKKGDRVQKKGKGEMLDLTLCAVDPFSPEGIRMKDLPLLRRGILKNIHGATRFCRYLGVKPTGDYSKVRCDNPGTLSFEEMKKRPCLVTVSFSDFQADDFTGNFGGEIRLAYLIDGERVITVTGGSINGRLPECDSKLEFSTDRYRTASYEGPFAVRVPEVAVAGSGD